MATVHTIRECDESCPSARTLKVSRSQPIYHQGEPSYCWWELVSGVVRTCRYLANGQRQLTAFYYAGEAFGLDAKSYDETAEAVTDVVLRRHLTPNDGDAWDELLAKALEKARQSIFLFGHKTAANRVAAFILAAADRAHAPGLDLVMTRSDIADHLNLTLHTVSRTISDFARRRLIALNGPQRVKILDIEGLRIAAGDADDRLDTREMAIRS